MTKRESKKQQIIIKSISLLKQYGYNGTSVQDIILQVGIPKGSFYNYFESKEEYLKDVLYYYFKEENKQDFLILEDLSLLPLDRIKQFYLQQVGCIKNCSVTARGCLVGNIIQELGDTVVEIDNVLKDIYNSIIVLLYNCLEEAHYHPSFHIDRRGFASFLMNSWQGTLLNFKINKDIQELDNFLDMLDSLL